MSLRNHRDKFLPYHYSRFNLRTNWPTTVFILNLALADLLYCLINLPLLALQKSGHDWNLGLTFCKIIANIRYSNAYADWMSLAMIAVSRCSSVTNPGKVTIFASRKARISILIGIRIYALTLLIPTNLSVGTLVSYHVLSCLMMNYFSDLGRIWNKKYFSRFSKCRQMLFEIWRKWVSTKHNIVYYSVYDSSYHNHIKLWKNLVLHVAKQ